MTQIINFLRETPVSVLSDCKSGTRFSGGVRVVSLCYQGQNGSGVRPTSTTAHQFWVKIQQSEAYHSPSHNAEIKNTWSLTSTLHIPFAKGNGDGKPGNHIDSINTG